ncbi:two-component system regulatory protein YycI [Domibacillus enclensis]|uniref:Two-component signal transduction system YycFG, regulatory protein YycI n=1 Tax=Domibacillus enclensis TaxID=1017273 RepID=A0A1N6YZH7_9BACI|nr:two-component system regulatory protein YycI [Domibacillus enclensis]OXS76544.1 hypothetical protein B1B05_12745 [Domibacillus enclensis]SIR19957.1 Two-component signal transduction system YycFG, regulatory protein YycI [Domibacillus enclensis]
MDWSKTKTIFIAVFLVLDIFLAVMFFNKYSTSQFTIIKQTTIEEKLQNDGVTYEKLPTDTGERALITAKPKKFTENDLLFLTKQTLTIQNEDRTEIESVLEKPYSTDGATRDKLNSFVKNNVYQGGEYSYWERNREAQTVTYFQKIDNKKLFENAYGKLVLTLDENENIVGYTQTMLDSVEENENEEAILPAVAAIDALYKNGYIQPESEISDVELGYYTLAQLNESQVLQVLTPTWYVELEKGDTTEEVFVNAFDGSIYQTESSES